MTHQAQDKKHIFRTTDGAIDYRFYAKRAHKLQGVVMAGGIKAIWRKVKATFSEKKLSSENRANEISAHKITETASHT